MTSTAKGVFAALAFVAMINSVVGAEEYPSRPIRIISAMAAGGLSDTAVRFIIEPLGRQLGQQVIVENRSGAGGLIGTEAAARSAADGYTLVVSSPSAFNIIPAVKKTSFDPKKDFVPLGQIWSAPQVLIVRSESNLKTVADLVAYAKSNPGKLAFGHAGNGTTTHLCIELLSREAHISVIQVPYRSGAQTVVDLLGGQLDAVFVTPQTLAPYLKKTRALAITDVQRSPLLPDVPTMAEARLPGVRVVNWLGLHALARTPPAALERLKTAVRAAQLDSEYRVSLAKIGMTTGTVGAERFAEMIDDDVQRLAPLVRSMGISFD